MKKGLKIVRWVALLTVTIILLPAALQLSQVSAVLPCPSTPITSNLNLTYDCTSPTNGIELAASGITLNCQGNSISLTGLTPSQWAIEVYGYVGDTVKNCKVSEYTGYGIYSKFTSGLTLTGNTVEGGTYGYYIYDASGLTLMGNTATGALYGFYTEYLYNVLVSGNTATGFTYDGFYVDEGQGGLLTKNTATSCTAPCTPASTTVGFSLYTASYGPAMYTLIRNKADNNYYGYYDESRGPGTLGMANTYINNECSGNTNPSFDYYAGITGSADVCTP